MMPPLHSRRLVAAVLLAACSSVSFAQNAPRPDAGQILREQKPRPPVGPLLVPEIRIDTLSPTPVPVADSGPRFTLQRLRLTGIDAAEAARLAEFTQAALGQETNLAGLQELARQIAERYRAEGWVLAAAYLPPQTIRNGEAEILIKKGRLGENEIRGFDHPGAKRLLAALPTDEPLASAVLERTLLLIEEQPGINDLRVELSPGKLEGASKLTLTVPTPVSGTSHRLYADNHGGYYSGQQRIGLRSRFDNLLGLSDRFDLILLGSEHNTWNGQIDWNTLLADNGLRGGFRLASVRYELAEDYKRLDAHGTAHTVGANLNYPVYRRFGMAMDLSAELEYRWLTDKIDQFDAETKKDLDTFTLGFAGQWRDGSGQGAWNLSQGFGDLDINSRDAKAADALRARTEGRYRKTGLILQRIQNVIGNSQLFMKYQQQWASKNLDSSEKLSLGGVNAVRAYPLGEVSGDEGYLARIDWRFPMSANCALGMGYDAGRVKINKNRYLGSSNYETRKGWAVFAEGRYRDFDLSASIAWRDSDEKAMSGPEKSPRLWVQAGWGF